MSCWGRESSHSTPVPVNGSTVRHRSAPRQRTYALSEGLAGSTAQGPGWRVQGPHETLMHVVARSAEYRRCGRPWRSRPDRGGRKTLLSGTPASSRPPLRIPSISGRKSPRPNRGFWDAWFWTSIGWVNTIDGPDSAMPGRTPALFSCQRSADRRTARRRLRRPCEDQPEINRRYFCADFSPLRGWPLPSPVEALSGPHSSPLVHRSCRDLTAPGPLSDRSIRRRGDAR